MTISSTVTKVSFAGNGSTTVFAYSFKIFAATDLEVIVRTDATGAESVQTLTTHYSVSGAGNASGGNVTFGSAPASGTTVVIRRVVPITQGTDYVENDSFGAESHEDALDRLTVIAQQQQEELDRAITAPTTDASPSLELPSSTARATRLMAFDSDGDVTTVATDSLSLATLQSFTDYRISTFTGNGSTASFTLSAEPGQEGNTQVFLDGVYQSKNSYNLVGAVLTFDTNIPSGVAIEVVHGQAAATYSPVAGSITFAHLADTIDEDNMSSNSATKIPTQQSVKAYVDAQVDAVDTLAEVLANGNGTGGNDIAVGVNDDITLVDGANIIFGTGGDGFSLFHNGSDSYITETGTGTGNLFILATDLTLGDKGNQHHYAHFISGGEAKLYYDNGLSFETTSGGGKVYGDLQITGGDIELGSSNDTTISRASAGVVTIEGQTVRTGTVGISDGGTGATTAAAAASALGVGTEDSPTFTGLTTTGNATLGDAAGDVNRSVGGLAAQGTGLPSAGAGVEMGFGLVSGEAHVQAFDRDGSAWEELRLRGSQISWDIAGNEGMRLDSAGRLGVGDSSPNTTAKMTVTGSDGAAGSLNYVMCVRNSDAYSTTPAGGILFQNKYNSSGSYADAGGIEVFKENATDGQYGFGLGLHTRANGAAVTEKVRIDPSGNLIVQPSSTSQTISVEASGGGAKIEMKASGGTLTTIGSTNNVPTAIQANSGEAIRVLTDQKVGIGTSSAATRTHLDGDANTILRIDSQNTASTAGTVMGEIRLNGKYHTGSALHTSYAASVIKNVKDSADGTGGSALTLSTSQNGGSGISEKLRITKAGIVRPGADNSQSLGDASYRWSEVFAGNGTINTSDEREKTEIAALDEVEQRVAVALKGLVKKYRFKDAVAAKGDAARIHVGVIAQEVVAAFSAEGLDATRYALLCHDEWEAVEAVLNDDGDVVTPALAAGDRYGIRYDELLAFIISAL